MKRARADGRGADERLLVSNARRTPALFGVSALLVLGGTSVLAGTISSGQPVAVASVVTADRSAAVLRADRAHADRLSRIVFAENLAAQKAAAQRKAAGLKAHKAAMLHKQAVANAAARKAVAKKKAATAAANRASARKAAATRSTRSSVRSTAPFTGSARTIGRQMAAARGWTGDQWVCLNNLWTAESGWGTTSGNPGGAYGIPQALPGTKMASAGSDWRTNPATQIKWGLNYIDGRYGSPCKAWNHFQSHRWY